MGRPGTGGSGGFRSTPPSGHNSNSPGGTPMGGRPTGTSAGGRPTGNPVGGRPNSGVPGGFRPTSPSRQNGSGNMYNGKPTGGARPTGSPPRGVPNGAPPNGAPPNGAPPRGASPNGASPNGAPPNGAPPNGAPPNGAPPSGRPPQNRSPQPNFGGRSTRGRYYPPRSPKRPIRRGTNNGCGNIIIGGVVVLIIVFIILMNALRGSCAGCVKGTESDVSNSTGTGDSGNSVSTPNSTSDPVSSSNTEPPKAPVIPVLTLIKNEPSKPFNSECVVDELKWFDDTKAAGESLKFVYDKLGIQPYVVFKKYDPALKTNEDKVRHCVDWYKANIKDEDTFLLMYFAEKASDAAVGYTVYYSGANAEKLAIEFKSILEDGINEYWFTDLSTDDVIKYAFEYTCDRITVKTAADLLPPETSVSPESSDIPTGATDSTGETDEGSTAETSE